MREVVVQGVVCNVAESFCERARGLIGRPAPEPGHGLLILHCNAIHTFFMKYAIDAIFLDRQGRVVRRVSNIRPWRPLVWGGFRAVCVLEQSSSAVRTGRNMV